jgi:hypothetical protein
VVAMRYVSSARRRLPEELSAPAAEERFRGLRALPNWIDSQIVWPAAARGAR